MLIGVISDTHGHIDPRLPAAFVHVDAIIHAGDVGGTHVLETLRTIAPIYAVYGNNDEKLCGLGLPLRKGFELGGVRFHVVHQLPRARANDRTQVVMFGHSHRTLIELRGAVLYLNPGASGRVGFHKLQTVATISIEHGVVTESDIIELGPRQPRGGA